MSITQITSKSITQEFTTRIDRGEGETLSGEREGECVVFFRAENVLVSRTMAWLDGDVLTLADRVTRLH
jgi:hypothetical protein